MQRILLQKYAAEHFSCFDLMEFCDDGYSGTNFKRPGMESLLEKVKKFEIDCILVKDFSRFARDYIELGSYLEQIFPFMGVRFISVNDSYDSRDYQGSIAGMDLNFKNLLYDLYSKDLSQKVRSSLTARKEAGQYISAMSPFGYEKDPNDRHGLLIEEEEAEVVRKIFSLAAKGNTSVAIARLLNRTSVMTPIEFKIKKGKTSRKPKGEKFLWSSSAICQILHNEIYIGNIVQKKYSKEFGCEKNHFNPREDWLISCNHHEPIIEKEVFYKVQEGRGRKRALKRSATHPLIGKLVCGCCKKNLGYRKGLNPYFTCEHRYSNGLRDCVQKVNAMFLEQYVLFHIQKKMEADKELEGMKKEAAVRLMRQKKELSQKRQNLWNRQRKLERQNFEAYQNYVMGKTGSFKKDKTMEQAIKKDLALIEESIQEAEALFARMKAGNESLSTEKEFSGPAKQIIEFYIEKILVKGEQNIEIYWNKKAQTLDSDTR